MMYSELEQLVEKLSELLEIPTEEVLRSRLKDMLFYYEVHRAAQAQDRGDPCEHWKMMLSRPPKPAIITNERKAA